MNRKPKPPVAQMRAKTAVRKAKPKASATSKHPRAKSSREKVRAYRERMRAKGLRLIQMWVPDSRAPGHAEVLSQTARRHASAKIRKAWTEALVPLPHGYATSFDDIADLAGSIAGLPSDLASNKDKYLRVGYGRKRHR